MSPLQGQNPHKSEVGHNTYKLPPVLSEMQARNPDKCKKFKYIRYQSASRLDAEPMTYEKIVVVGFYF